MGRKGGGKFKKKESHHSVKKNDICFDSDDEEMMYDEVDAFHKQRDVVPLDVNGDMEETDEDDEQPVYDVEEEEEEEEEEDEDDKDNEDDDIQNDDIPPKGLAAKMLRTQKYLRAKFGGVEDEILDDAEEEEQERVVWGSKKDMYGADVDYEPQSSDDEDAAEEEAEVLKLQSEKAKALSMEDFGLEDTSQDETDMEPTFEEILDHGRPASKNSFDKEINNETGLTYEIVKKDLNSLTKEEQMDVVYSSAPELVGLLSELNDALEQLDSKINPLLNKIREQESAKKGRMHYLEVKQLLLQSFCQAITFYLLLKSEGQPVRDHPVVSRLVEIKSLLDKMKDLDEHLPSDLADVVNKLVSNETLVKLGEGTGAKASDSFTKSQIASMISSEKYSGIEPEGAVELAELNTLENSKNIQSQRKHQDKQVGVESMEMLKVRAALEEKLKQKGVFSSISPKNVRVREHLQPVNRQLETLDDFNDEAMEIDRRSNRDASLSHSSKLSQQLSLHPNKRKIISGDDDIPKRDDIGERRRKHELRVLAGAGIKSVDNFEDETDNISSDGVAEAYGKTGIDSDSEYAKQMEQQHAGKLVAKSEKYTRTPEVASLPDSVDGKRLITPQMEKNRGLTRARKKLTKNPRKKYKLKHKKAEVRRKGQVREIRKLTGHYGGEASGINAGISRSIRFKS